MGGGSTKGVVIQLGKSKSKALAHLAFTRDCRASVRASAHSAHSDLHKIVEKTKTFFCVWHITLMEREENSEGIINENF